MVSKLIQKDVNIADFGIEAITDSGRVQLSENKKGALSVDTYNKMIDPESEEYQMSEEPQAEITQDYEIFYSEDGVKKVRTAGGNVYPHGTPEYTKVTGESSTEWWIANCNASTSWHLVLCELSFQKIIINELNEHIDNEIISKSKSRADGLVGQLKNTIINLHNWIFHLILKLGNKFKQFSIRSVQLILIN